MRRFLIAYAFTALCFLSLDALWLGLVVPRLYQPEIGPLLLAQPKLLPAALFYLGYVFGVVAFAVLPAQAGAVSMRRSGALWRGALLGVIAYGTYDMTNLATLAGWSTLVSVVDIAWGGIATAVAAALATLATARFAPAIPTPPR